MPGRLPGENGSPGEAEEEPDELGMSVAGLGSKQMRGKVVTINDRVETIIQQFEMAGEADPKDEEMQEFVGLKGKQVLLKLKERIQSLLTQQEKGSKVRTRTLANTVEAMEELPTDTEETEPDMTADAAGYSDDEQIESLVGETVQLRREKTQKLGAINGKEVKMAQVLSLTHVCW